MLKQQTKEEGVDLATLLLKFVLGNPQIDHVVVGVNSAAQLKELVDIEDSEPLSSSLYKWAIEQAIDDENIIVPTKWKS